MKSSDPEYVYIATTEYKSVICSPNTKFDGTIGVISTKKLTENSKKVKLSSIKEKCYINGYGWYNPLNKQK